MTDAIPLPLSIRDVGPHPEAVRLTGVRSDGLPDGVHTGGAWLWGQEVFKPLDGRPYANAENHYPTDELTVLELMAGQPLFPRNWRLEQRHGRRFVVRPLCQVFPRDLPWTALTESDALLVEGAVRALNLAGWQINDPVSLARDPAGQLFILDLSAAGFAGTGHFGAEELWRIERFFETAGFERLLALRRTAYGVIAPCRFSLEHRSYRYVYTCPSPDTAQQIPEAIYITSQQAAEYWRREKRDERLEDALRFSPAWLITRAPLPAELCAELGFVWGWSPLRTGAD
jgi:hypothetical protein